MNGQSCDADRYADRYPGRTRARIRDLDPDRIGGALHQRFLRSYQQGTLITAQDSGALLVAHLLGEDTGQIWDAATNT